MFGLRSWFRAIVAVVGVTSGLAAQAGDSLRPAPVVMWRDVGIVASGAVLATVAQRADVSIRREVRSGGWQENGTLDAITEFGNPWGDPGTVYASLSLWVGGRLVRRPVIAAAGFRAVEAVAVSGWITQALKNAIGRARPRISPDESWDVEFWRGQGSYNGDYEAMPSGHTTAAFAFAAAVTSELAWRNHPRTRVVGITTYTMAAMTGYARMHSNAHWLSDVIVGAAIGSASAFAITRWHATRPGNRIDGLALGTPAEPTAAPTEAPRVMPFVAPGRQGTSLVGATIAWR